ncbi:glycosyltransferase family 4 protein [Flavobacterium sp. HNIBRBA15423]|uniref:glycosyltransferase family 4 protein n=1 Tax=Flavobacterium sp. HNIBRBA15423 TaxID=3458683 RepID=UPI004043FE22
MNKKKIFIITTIPLSFIFFKGQLSLLKEEFEVTLISSPEESLFETAEQYKVNRHGILMKREIALFNDFVSLIKLISYFFKNRPDIVHGNTPKGSFLSMIASWFCKVPTRIYYVHGLRYQGANGFKKKLLIYMERISCKLATDIFAVSNGVKEVMYEDGVTTKKINVIWNGSINGIDSDFFNLEIVNCINLQKQYQIKENDFVFGFIGRIVADKGINELVLAFKKVNQLYPNTKLVLVGNYEDELDPLLPKVKKEIDKNKSIIIAGFQKDIRPFYKLMNLFVFPSYREGFGISLMEAAAMSVPAISSNIIGCKEIIDNEVNGYLIPSKDEKALFEKMKFCIENQNKIKQMASVTRDIILSKFEQKQLWNKTIHFYKDISK